MKSKKPTVKKEKEVEVYCKSCGSCGEAGCCNPFKCIKTSVKKNNECKYGKENLKDAEMFYELGRRMYDRIAEQKIMTFEQADDLFEVVYKEVYGDKNVKKLSK